MSRRLHIIRHAAVVIDEKAQATEWSLSPAGEGDVAGLLGRFDPSSLRRVITSKEKKAKQTGKILAKSLGLPIEARQGLEEHHRYQNGFLAAAAFRTIVADFFARPKEQVFGDESADTSLNRFDAAIRMIMDETDNDELVVSHGRIISLFLAARRNDNPMDIWASLELPDCISIDWSNP